MKICIIGGGRVNPIIPICNNEIQPNWKELIKYLNPDYIMPETVS